MGASVHDSYFYSWTQEQAAALRAAGEAGTNLPLDWENVAEEIESLGARDRRELRSQIRTILEQLLKLQTLPGAPPSSQWQKTVLRSRREVGYVLDDSPSLRRQVEDVIAKEMSPALRDAERALMEFGGLTPELAERLRGAAYTPEQVLGDTIPGTSASEPADFPA